MSDDPQVDPRIVMVRYDMRTIPFHALPEGFSLRPMCVRDISLWTDIWRDVEDSNVIGDTLFENAFGCDWDEIGRRCFIVSDSFGRSAGTISAWFEKSFAGFENWGRIHYVAVRRAYQGRGLGRGMLSSAMNVLADLGHNRSFLVTQTYRHTAIRLYLDCGFVPHIVSPESLASWREVAAVLPHPSLLESLEVGI